LPAPPPLTPSAEANAVGAILKLNKTLTIPPGRVLSAAQPNDSNGDYLVFFNVTAVAASNNTFIFFTDAQSAVNVTLPNASAGQIYVLDVSLLASATVSYAVSLASGTTSGNAPVQNGHALIAFVATGPANVSISCPNGGLQIGTIEVSVAQ
jgi:hypothetical protein